jgi:hypothetical protein
MRQGYRDLVDREIVGAKRVGQSEAKVLFSAEGDFDSLTDGGVGECNCVSCLMGLYDLSQLLTNFHVTPGCTYECFWWQLIWFGEHGHRRPGMHPAPSSVHWNQPQNSRVVNWNLELLPKKSSAGKL